MSWGGGFVSFFAGVGCSAFIHVAEMLAKTEKGKTGVKDMQNAKE